MDDNEIELTSRQLSYSAHSRRKDRSFDNFNALHAERVLFGNL